MGFRDKKQRVMGPREATSRMDAQSSAPGLYSRLSGYLLSKLGSNASLSQGSVPLLVTWGRGRLADLWGLPDPGPMDSWRWYLGWIFRDECVRQKGEGVFHFHLLLSLRGGLVEGKSVQQTVARWKSKVRKGLSRIISFLRKSIVLLLRLEKVEEYIRRCWQCWL